MGAKWKLLSLESTNFEFKGKHYSRNFACIRG